MVGEDMMKEKLRVAMFGQKRLSREGGIEIVVKELCTRMARDGCQVTCYNRSGHHVSGAEYDRKIEYEGICQKSVPTIERKGLAAVSSSAFAAFYSAFGKYDVIHIHAEGPAFFAWLPKMFGKRVIVTIHGIDWQREKWQSGFGSKFIRQGEKNAVKYADEIVVLSKGVQDYFRETYGRETHFIPNGVSRPVNRKANLITDRFGLTSDSYILFLGRLVPEKGISVAICYPSLESEKNSIISAYLILEECYVNGRKLLVAGNGGSAADAEHIVGELMKGFKMPRKPRADFAEKLMAENQELGTVLAENLQGALPAIALDGHPALSTAYMNDCEPLLCFAQQVNGYGKAGDVRSSTSFLYIWKELYPPFQRYRPF